MGFHRSAGYAAGVGVGNVATNQAIQGDFVVYSSKRRLHWACASVWNSFAPVGAVAVGFGAAGAGAGAVVGAGEGAAVADGITSVPALHCEMKSAFLVLAAWPQFRIKKSEVPRWS